MVVRFAEDRSAAPAALIGRARELRREFARTAAAVDASGTFPLANLERIYQAGFERLVLPREFGGLKVVGQGLSAHLSTLAEILTELAAGESSTAQAWMVHLGVARLLYSGMVDLPHETKRQLAREVLEEGARFISSASEPAAKRQSYRTAGKRAPGGLRVSGTKAFNTGSDAARYAQVPLLLEGFPSVEAGGLYFALVRLDAPGVILHNDWDNMGQRATASQTITYRDVFVPDGFHYGFVGGGRAFYQPDNILGPVSQVLLNAVVLGMGFGALEAMIDYARQTAKPLTPGLDVAATEDPIIRWHIGRYSSQLAAARALQRETAAMLEGFNGDPSERAELSVQMMRTKVAIFDAVLTTTGELHRVAGGRATSNKYRLDRFWRNGRTLSVHDPVDAKLQLIGAYELDGSPPPVSWLT